MKKLFAVLFLLCALGLQANAYTQQEAIQKLQDMRLNPKSVGLFCNFVNRGKFDFVKLYVEAGQIDLNKRYSGSTYLIQAVFTKNPDIAIYLMENGADPEIKTKDGGSALFFAVKNGQTDVVRKILEKPNMNLKKQEILCRFKMKTIAKRRHYDEIYKMLVDYEEKYKEYQK